MQQKIFCQIANLPILLSPAYPLLRSRTRAYAVAPSEATGAFEIVLSPEFLAEKQRENPHLTLEDCEYIWAGEAFAWHALDCGAFILHASAISYRGRAYLFSAPSGTGKSTQAELWRARFGAEVAYLNDDKPLIRKENGGFYAYGTPFSGKTDRSENRGAPIAAVYVLARAAVDRRAPLSGIEALFHILDQTPRPADSARFERLLDMLDGFLRETPIYRLECTPTENAVSVVLDGLDGENAAQ